MFSRARTLALLPALLLAALLLPLGCQPPAGANPAAGGSIETHYSPQENLEHFDLALLASAQRSIDLCGFSFTDVAVGDALVHAAARGVHVRVYLDRGQSDAELQRSEKKAQRTRRSFEPEEIPGDSGAGAGITAVITTLAATQNIEVRIKHSRVLMHLKSYAVDGAALRSGSANFSPSALKRQDNDLLLTRDARAVRRFERNFEQMWSRPDNETLQP